MGLLERLRSLFGNKVLVGGVEASARNFQYLNSTLADNETIFSAITMLSGAMASLPVTLKRYDTTVSPVEHPVAEMLAFGPNPEMTTFDFISCLETLRDSTGAGYAIKELNAHGKLVGAWPMKTAYVTPVRDSDTKELYYRVKDSPNGGTYYIHHSFILAVTHISADGLHPINPIDVLKSSLDYDKEVKEFSIDQMSNGLRAKLAIKWAESQLGPDQIQEYNEVLKTFKKSGILYLDKGKEVQELKESTVIDPKVFEVENITIARVARVYTIPLDKFLPGKTSFSSAEQSDLNYLRDTILPNVRRYEQAMSQWLLSERERMDGMGIKFSLNGFARADMQTRGEYYVQAIRNGWMCQDDIRRLEDEPPLPNGQGQHFFVSKDLIPISELIREHLNSQNKTERGREIE